ncbi:MAG: type II toxin-antitoxin system HigA family antitoxin [Saprospiraceae bacterium]
MPNPALHHIQIAPLTDEASYQSACDLVETLMDMGELESPDEASQRLAYLDALATLIDAYEAKNFKFNQIELTLVQVIEQALEQLNLTKKDLAKMLGSNRVTEIFSGKRDLSMAQVRILSRQLHIPTDLLIFSKRVAA